MCKTELIERLILSRVDALSEFDGAALAIKAIQLALPHLFDHLDQLQLSQTLLFLSSLSAQ